MNRKRHLVDSTDHEQSHRESVTCCFLCKQRFDEVKNMDKAVEHFGLNEEAAFEKFRLNECAGDLRVNDFAIYDQCGHLCELDGGLVEDGVMLYITGYLEVNAEHNKKKKIHVFDVGPVSEWCTEGFLGKGDNLITVTTDKNNYILTNPSNEYKTLASNLFQKVYISKIIIEYLEDNYHLHPSYEDLLKYITQFPLLSKDSNISEDLLLKNAQFVCDQVANLELVDYEEDEMVDVAAFLSLPCIEQLMTITGVKPRYHKIPAASVQIEHSVVTTPTVQKVFSIFLQESGCLQSSIFPEKAKPNFNREGISENSINFNKPIRWMDKQNSKHERVYFKNAYYGKNKISRGDFFTLANLYDGNAVVRVNNMWHLTKSDKTGYFHGQVFVKGKYTLLGEMSCPDEVFLTDVCVNLPISHLKTAVMIIFHGKSEMTCETIKLKIYLCKKKYDLTAGRFEDLPEQSTLKPDSCFSCDRLANKTNENIPKVSGEINKRFNGFRQWSSLQWKNVNFLKGLGVYLTPSVENYKNNNRNKSPYENEKKYLNDSDNKEENNIEPFSIGCIAKILSKTDNTDHNVRPQNIYLLVNYLRRMETQKNMDGNCLFWCSDQHIIPFYEVQGSCHLTYIDNIPKNMSPQEWSKSVGEGFYFKEACSKGNKIVKVPQTAMTVGKLAKRELTRTTSNNAGSLRTMDIFAGCGGLSSGLAQSGVSNCLWAVEIDRQSALSYKYNHPDCKVFTEDCNQILQDVITGKLERPGGSNLPKVGDVELLCGGPPCQGFSGLNRFTSRDYSTSKNSLIATFLSYCEHYRPTFIIMENVKNFIKYKNGLMLKLTMRCLLDLDYQCSFGILQAANFGVPQSRQRLIIMAALPNSPLPNLPAPTHTFFRNVNCVTVDGRVYRFDSFSAPHRTITIREAIDDLPFIENGASSINLQYGTKARSYFQKQVRFGNGNTITDHICKLMSPISMARIQHIPCRPRADWRDLPNISVKLTNNTRTEILNFKYSDKMEKKEVNYTNSGVCACFLGQSCVPADRQTNTLIPWSVVHTASKNNNWIGVYGRLDWNSYFPTTITNPNPMGKIGRVIHPEQDRVMSVRECARSQGFQDTFRFFGRLQDKHKQIGNAVPPPLAAALGLQLKKSLQGC